MSRIDPSKRSIASVAHPQYPSLRLAEVLIVICRSPDSTHHFPNRLGKPPERAYFMPQIISDWRASQVCTWHPLSWFQPPLVISEQKSVKTENVFVAVHRIPYG
ncbi:hypothetical protein TNCV_430791 [Trichonephila clavipes]|nr:hypothetical protein TNCV_430791 [Trichonephila clavipes]